MKDTTALTNDDIKEIKNLLISALIMNSDFEFHVNTDGTTEEAKRLEDMLNTDDVVNKKFLIDCIIATAMHVLGLSNDDVATQVGEDKCNNNIFLYAIAQTSDEDVDKIGKLIADNLNLAK